MILELVRAIKIDMNQKRFFTNQIVFRSSTQRRILFKIDTVQMKSNTKLNRGHPDYGPPIDILRSPCLILFCFFFLFLSECNAIHVTALVLCLSCRVCPEKRNSITRVPIDRGMRFVALHRRTSKRYGRKRPPLEQKKKEENYHNYPSIFY